MTPSEAIDILKEAFQIDKMSGSFTGAISPADAYDLFDFNYGFETRMKRYIRGQIIWGEPPSFSFEDFQEAYQMFQDNFEPIALFDDIHYMEINDIQRILNRANSEDMVCMVYDEFAKQTVVFAYRDFRWLELMDLPEQNKY